MIHQYILNGYHIILDVNSGSIHVTDEKAYEAIRLTDQGKNPEEIRQALFARYGRKEQDPEQGIKADGVAGHGITDAEITECLQDIEELRAAGKLFSEETYADKAFDLKKRNTVIKALCLLVAHTCNLNCSYCFAAQGNFHGQHGLMSFETGKRALDFLVENSGMRRNLEVDFFGGEPLVNFEVCKQLVAYARSIEKEKNKNFRFTLTTNGIGVTDAEIERANREG